MGRTRARKGSRRLVGLCRATALDFALADADGDGFLDYACHTASLGNAGIELALGDGNGRFPTRLFVPLEPFPTATVAADLDLDGRTDLAVSLSGSDEIALLLQP